jgi:hypothetical protein
MDEYEVGPQDNLYFTAPVTTLISPRECFFTNVSLKVGFYASSIVYSPGSSIKQPLWTNFSEAARISMMYGYHFDNNIDRINDKYSDYLDVSRETNFYLMWGDLSELESEWKGHAITTLIIAILVPVITIFIVKCYIWLKGGSESYTRIN